MQTCPPVAGVAKFLNPDAKSTNSALSLLSQVLIHPFQAQGAASQEGRAVVALPPALTFVRFTNPLPGKYCVGGALEEEGEGRGLSSIVHLDRHRHVYRGRVVDEV